MRQYGERLVPGSQGRFLPNPPSFQRVAKAFKTNRPRRAKITPIQLGRFYTLVVDENTSFTIGIPTLAVLVGILLNRNDANRLDARITSVGHNLRAEIGALRIQTHHDLMAMVGASNELDKRIARLETRS